MCDHRPNVLVLALVLYIVGGLPPADAADLTKDEARQQVVAACDILKPLGFPMGPPQWYPRFTLTVNGQQREMPSWYATSPGDLASGVKVGEVAWDVVVQVSLRAADARDRYQRSVSDSKDDVQRFMTTCAGEGHAGVMYFHNAWFLCGNTEFRLRWKKGVPEGVNAIEATREEGLTAVKQMALRVHDAFVAKGFCRAVAGPARDLDPPIPSAAIDAYLDLLAAKLKASRELASAPNLDPLAPPTGPFSYEQAAMMAQTVWLECQGLIRAHIDKRLLLTEAQKQRLKAFGWWVDFIVQRGAHPFRIQWTEPPYPLFGPIAQTVPTPPQYKGEDITTFVMPYWGTTEAITDDYAWATASTALRFGDIYYTGGLLYTAYLACTSNSLAEVAMAGLTSIPHIGKWIGAALCTYVEANAVYRLATDGTNPLTWDQHAANICGVALTGLQAYRTFRPNATRANPAAGIDDGNIPPEVAQRFGGKSFQLGARQKKQLPGGLEVEVADADYAVVGPYQGKTAQGLVGYEKRTVAILKDTDGNERYFALNGDTLGDPIFFLGERGYHVWSHLTEIKSGHKTGFPSVKGVMDESPEYLGTLKDVEKTFRDPQGNLKAAQDSYIGFVNKLIDDGSYEKMQGFYQYTKQGATPTSPRIPVGNAEANTFIRVPRPTTDPGQVTHYPIRISIDPGTGKLMNVFVITPKKPTEIFMSEMLAESLKKHFYAWNDCDKVIFTCPDLKALLGALGTP
ncbi:hypothetical protein LLH23_10390 [bacterium]|nr:hypothetical protein [bacterium]